MSTKPTDPEVLRAIDACLAELRLLVVKLKKSGAISIHIGCVKDNISSLELVRDYGSYGGKVPYPVKDPSLSVFRAHGLEDLIHPAPPSRNRSA